MKMLLVSVRDNKTGFFSPTTEQNEQSAIRNFYNMLRNASNDSLLHYSPADFDLYTVGTFDIENGLLIPDSVPTMIAQGGKFNDIQK